MRPNRVKKYKKEHFLPFFNFLTVWFAWENYSKRINSSVKWPRMSDVSVSSFWCPNWPSSAEYPLSREKYGFWRLFRINIFCLTIKWPQNFSHFSMSGNFPLLTKYICAKFNADPKECSQRKCPKEYLLTGFKTLLRVLRVPAWKHCLMSMISLEEQYLFI